MNDACVLAGKPYVGASIARFGDAFGLHRRGPCYRYLFRKCRIETVPSCAQAGVLGTVPGLFRTLQAHGRSS